jgi:hypothetical protein
MIRSERLHTQNVVLGLAYDVLEEFSRDIDSIKNNPKRYGGKPIELIAKSKLGGVAEECVKAVVDQTEEAIRESLEKEKFLSPIIDDFMGCPEFVKKSKRIIASIRTRVEQIYHVAPIICNKAGIPHKIQIDAAKYIEKYAGTDITAQPLHEAQELYKSFISNYKNCGDFFTHLSVKEENELHKAFNEAKRSLASYNNPEFDNHSEEQ